MFIYILMLLGVPYNKKKTLIRKIMAAPTVILNRVAPGLDRYALYHISLLPLMSVRKLIYRTLGASIGKNVRIHFKAEIRGITKLKIEEGSIVGDNAILDARNKLYIGKNVNISSNVSFYSEQHNYRDKLFRCNQTTKQSIEIYDRAWIGCNVIVLPGVTIGEGAVCCAGCVVTKDVEPWSVVAGIPAQKINQRPKDQIYMFKSKLLALI
jgi:acetyltransferase